MSVFIAMSEETDGRFSEICRATTSKEMNVSLKDINKTNPFSETVYLFELCSRITFREPKRVSNDVMDVERVRTRIRKPKPKSE